MFKRLFIAILFCVIMTQHILAVDVYNFEDDTNWADIPALDPPFVVSPQIDVNLGGLDGYELSSVDIMPLYSLDSGTTPINSGLRAIIRNLIGNYSPVVVQYQYTNGTNTQYLREILPDYEWMCSCAIFALVLYCTYRIVGCFLWRK